MGGTQAGGKQAAKTNKAIYGETFYADIGRKGGKNGNTGGFYNNPELARIVGALGGAKSKRGPWTEAEREAHRKANEAKREKDTQD